MNKGEESPFSLPHAVSIHTPDLLFYYHSLRKEGLVTTLHFSCILISPQCIEGWQKWFRNLPDRNEVKSLVWNDLTWLFYGHSFCSKWIGWTHSNWFNSNKCQSLSTLPDNKPKQNNNKNPKVMHYKIAFTPPSAISIICLHVRYYLVGLHVVSVDFFINIIFILPCLFITSKCGAFVASINTHTHAGGEVCHASHSCQLVRS